MIDQTRIDAFTRGLHADGYPDPVEITWEAGTDNPDHTHDFTARLLVLEGAMRLGQDGDVRQMAPGDSCELQANTVHSESVGTSGVKLLVSRK